MALCDPNFPVLYRFDPETSTVFLKKIYFFSRCRFSDFSIDLPNFSPSWPLGQAGYRLNSRNWPVSRSVYGPGSRSIETAPKTGY